MNCFNNSRLHLTLTSPPQSFTEPLTLAEARAFLSIPAADTTQDTMIGALISAAREVAELRQGRDLVAKQYDLTMDSIPAVVTTRDGLSTVDLFQYRDSVGDYHPLTEDVDFITDTVSGLVMPVYGTSWPSFTPWPTGAVLVRYTVSPRAIDIQVLLGMRFLVSQWYVNRIPAEAGANSVQQYPYCLALLDHGRVESV